MGKAILRMILSLCIFSHVFTGHGPLGTPSVLADVPKVLNYQGRLTQTSGAPLIGDHSVTFRIYDAETAGNKLWEEVHQVSLTNQDNGLFSTSLGSLTSFGTLDFNQPLWLSLEVDGEGEMVPRQQLASVSYAINADMLDGLTATQLLRADVDTVAAGKVTLASPGTALLVKPATAPAANTKLLDIQNASGASTFSVDLEGDVSVAGAFAVGSLPLHASAHQPGGADPLPTAPAVSVASANSDGTATSLARADHAHQGLHSLNVSNQPLLFGDVTLSAGPNVSLSQAGQAITISASGGGMPGNRESAFASSPVEIGTASDTTLASVTVTKSQATSVLLVVATVQLNHTSNPNNKLVDVKLFRDAAQLDASYRARIGTAGQAVSELPVTVQAWDASPAGTYTFRLSARSSGAGAQATVRRLSVIELL